MRRAALVLILLAVPAIAAAQDRRWEVEGYAGMLAAQTASAGSTTIPPPGPALVTSTPTFPARATSSWFFGDGAMLLNGVLDDFGSTSRIAPLDPAFGPLPSTTRPAYGARVRRWLNPHLALEVSVDTFAGSTFRTGDLPAAVAATRDSFVPAFIALFTSGPFSRTAVSAEGASAGGDARDIAITAAFNRDIGRLGPLQAYVTGGAGVFATRGGLPSAALVGHYSTAIVDEVPIDETDRVLLRFTRSASAVAVLGGGVRHDVSAAWGVRADVRVLLGPDTTRLRLETNPSVARGTPTGFIESFTNPAIQFSNDPSSGRRSSLNDAPQDFDVFNGGVMARTVVTVGVSRRF